MTGEQEELILNIVIIGGITLAGLLIAISLTGLVIMYKARMKRKNIEKEIFNDKQRTNGRHKH